jgi:DNA-binding FadR family transcriptional regulator
MFSNLSAMTGIPEGKPKRPTRRGGGRHKPAAKPVDAHHEKLNAAMASGDHAAAKNAALTLAKALHQMQAKTAPTATGTSPSQPVDSV